MSENAPTDREHLDVLVIGAGLSGVCAGHYLQANCPWATYSVFEARDALGGTWDLFRYPGVRSDSDMYTLGYSFNPWLRPNSIADGSSILDYIRETAATEGIDSKIRYGHRVVSADWNSAEARWHIVAERRDPGSPDSGSPDSGSPQRFELTCNYVLSCSGYYRYDRGHDPQFDGTEEFQGQIVHPQFWPENLDYADKKVVVIGSGATAVTLVPAMASTASHVTMLQRSPTYMMALPSKMPTTKVIKKVVPSSRQGDVLRWFNALTSQAFYQLSQRRPEAVKKLIRRGLERELPQGYDLDTHFSPRYNPWDQRLCLVADGDLFKAIGDGTASIVTDEIERFSAHGLVLKSGKEIEADVVVTATGLEVLFIGGVQVSVDGEPVDLPSRLVYKGMMLEGVPNMAMVVGYTNASWTLRAELTCDYFTRLMRHARITDNTTMVPVNDDPTIGADSLLGLSSGYVQRAADKMPKQGDRYPWRVYQSYLKDFRALRRADVVDEHMRFSRPPQPASNDHGATVQPEPMETAEATV